MENECPKKGQKKLVATNSLTLESRDESVLHRIENGLVEVRATTLLSHVPDFGAGRTCPWHRAKELSRTDPKRHGGAPLFETAQIVVWHTRRVDVPAIWGVESYPDNPTGATSPVACVGR